MQQGDLRRLTALTLWLVAILMAFAFSSWRMHDLHSRSEAILSTRASAVAEEISSLLAIPGWDLEVQVVRPVVFAAMRNPELYAVKIARGDILLEGQRRGRTEELEPWDGVLTERTVQAISPILSDTGQVGTVEVYLRVDKTLDPAHAANAQEMLRFFLSVFLATLCFVLYLCSCGELAQFSKSVRRFWDWFVTSLGNVCARRNQDSKVIRSLDGRGPAIDLEAAHILQTITAQCPDLGSALFVHVFAHGPQILSRLLAEENYEALLHLLGLLERSAPCLGAFALQHAATAAREAVQSGEGVFSAEVEACISALEKVLKALQSQN